MNRLLFISAYPSYVTFSPFLCQSRFTAISFDPRLLISVHPSSIHLYLLLSLVYTPLYLSIPCLFTSIFSSIQINAYLFQFCIIYLSLCFLYPPESVSISRLILLYPSISLLIRIHTYLYESPFIHLSLFFIYSCVAFFVFLSQSRFTAISFDPRLLISVYPSSIHLYLLLSLLYTPLYLSIPCLFTPVFSSIQINTYLIQFCILCLSLCFVYPPESISIIRLILVYPSVFLLIQIHIYFFKTPFIHLSLSFIRNFFCIPLPN